jgi:hypothetical protein
MFSQGRSMSETNVKAQDVKFWKVSRTKKRRRLGITVPFFYLKYRCYDNPPTDNLSKSRKLE